MADDKVRENRLRRMASRQRLTLRKSTRRDPCAWDYGRYWLVKEDDSSLSPERGHTLDEVEAVLAYPYKES